MSTNFNRRRGASALKPRPVRVCFITPAMNDHQTRHVAIYGSVTLRTKKCTAAVRPDRNGNRCEEHRTRANVEDEGNDKALK
jgi:hypothetical protein